MVKVITYGTYDMLHYGHLRLLERAKALGDWLVVGVTSDDFDRARGKINSRQTLAERMASVRATGLADEIIVEEYEGQKINDIRRMDIDIFTVGSDWEGKFDYLNEYCRVIYLPRTEGISSSELRTEKQKVRIGLLGAVHHWWKFVREAAYVNGVELSGICCDVRPEDAALPYMERYEELLALSDAVYIISKPEHHARDIEAALRAGKHVICESPLTNDPQECTWLYRLAAQERLILMEAIKTAYSTAFQRLVLLARSGKIGQVVSVDSVCTSLQDSITQLDTDLGRKWNSVAAWGPVALLPVFQILGTSYRQKVITTKFLDKGANIDAFTKIDFTYPEAVASIKVAKGAKAEGELVITGTKGYIYVPAPWWKTDYFEVRYEDAKNNQRFFYPLEGEGIRYEIATFARAVEARKDLSVISEKVSWEISNIIDHFNKRIDMIEI